MRVASAAAVVPTELCWLPRLRVCLYFKAPMYTKALLADDEDACDTKLLSVDFVKKYIQYAKQKLTPSLSEDAANIISEACARTRTRD